MAVLAVTLAWHVYMLEGRISLVANQGQPPQGGIAWAFDRFALNNPRVSSYGPISLALVLLMASRVLRALRQKQA
jgi:hypothetical protein